MTKFKKVCVLLCVYLLAFLLFGTVFNIEVENSLISAMFALLLLLLAYFVVRRSKKNNLRKKTDSQSPIIKQDDTMKSEEKTTETKKGTIATITPYESGYQREAGEVQPLSLEEAAIIAGVDVQLKNGADDQEAAKVWSLNEKAKIEKVIGFTALPYDPPPVELLDSVQDAKKTKAVLKKKGSAVVKMLESNDIQSKLVACDCNSQYTRYEIKLAQGIRLQQLKDLEDKIAEVGGL